jgi:hypothetical protein
LEPGERQQTMMRGKTLAIATICALIASLWGCTRNALPIKVGEPKEQVRQEQGSPGRIYIPSLNKTVAFSAAAGFADVPMHDVWNRRLKANEFDVKVVYEEDSSASRLHPTARVRLVGFYPDKPQPIRALLKEIPEAHSLCAQGCRIAAVYAYDAPGLDPLMYVCPEATGAEWWRSTNTRVCFDVWFEAQSLPKNPTPPFAWDRYKIKFLNLESLTTAGLTEPSSYWHTHVDDLGAWAP